MHRNKSIESLQRFFSVVGAFIIPVFFAGLLFSFKDRLFYSSVWMYKGAWVVLVSATLAVFLLRPRPSKIPIGFPREDVVRIAKALPYDVIKLYHTWFGVSLEKCYGAYRTTCTKAALSAFAKTLADTLVRTFNRLPKAVLYQVLEERNKDNAVIALLFFTVLIRVLKAQENTALPGYGEVFTRITLGTAEDYLFREHYRLYELGALVAGHWRVLHFNRDIASLLQSALLSDFCEANVLADRKKQTEPQTSGLAMTHKNGTLSEAPCTAVDITCAPEKRAGHANTPSESRGQHAENPLPPIPPVLDDSDIVARFFRWLQRHVLRKPINGDTYFYQDYAHYGKSQIFLSEGALQDFSKKTHQDFSTITAVLVDQKLSDGKSYQLHIVGQTHRRLLAVRVHFRVECFIALTGRIEEVL